MRGDAHLVAELRRGEKIGHPPADAGQINLREGWHVAGKAYHGVDKMLDHGQADAFARVLELLFRFARKLLGGGKEILVQQDALVTLLRLRNAVLGDAFQSVGGGQHLTRIRRQLRAGERGVRTRGEIVETIREPLQILLESLDGGRRAVHSHRLSRQKRFKPLVEEVRHLLIVGGIQPGGGQLRRERVYLALSAVTLERKIHHGVEPVIVQLREV